MITDSADCAPAPQPDPVETPAAEEPAPDRIVIDTRFGRFEFDTTKAVTISRGLLGFADHTVFGIANLPQPGFEHFVLLQSLNDPEITFVVLPLEIVAGLIDAAHIDDARKTLKIAPEDLAVVLVVAIRQIADRPQISVNLRAPIFLDSRNRTGWQFVLGSGNYSVRHVLNPGEDTAPTHDAPQTAVK